MEEENENPLDLIFQINNEGETTEEFQDIQQIPEFFNYLKNPDIDQQKKINVIEQLQKKFNVNRYLIEYFSIYNNNSIYIFLIELFISQETTEELKIALINFISIIINNIETGKEIYEYIFQKLSKIYRNEDELNPDNVNNYLRLLNAILGSTEKCLKPRNYFTCSGNGQFILDCYGQLTLGNAFSILLNFKIGISDVSDNDKEKRISNLIVINFGDDNKLSIDLEYPFYIIIKDLNQDYKRKLRANEFTFLFVTFIPIPQFNSIKVILYSPNANDQITSLEFEIFKQNPIKSTDCIISIEFFKKFYGEVSSIVMFSQKEHDNTSLLNHEFVEKVSKLKGGLWKKKNIENFIQILKENTRVEIEEKKENKILGLKKGIKSEEKTISLYDDLISIFTPMNCYNTRTVEDYLGNNQLILNGDIRNHKYQCYQKKIDLVCSLHNFFPIAEMFLIYKELLTENNFELFLQIINNLIMDRKDNMMKIKYCKFFKILCLFFEKYPNNIFTSNILTAFFDIGKSIFSRLEKKNQVLTSNYFNHILLNEKILSKFDEKSQVIFWKNMYLFCQSDKSQIEILINIHRLCLLLRYYDKNKFFEMCCEEHLSVFKEEFIGSKKVMNPPMKMKLSNLKEIMDLIILEQEPKNAVSLFKLLTLDLSPCLTKFILNLFINAIEKDKQKGKDWTKKLIQELFKANIQVIIANTFIHSLPDIRIDIIRFIYLIYQQLKKQNEIKNFKKIENMIKTCLLPQKMFYENITYFTDSKILGSAHARHATQIFTSYNNINSNDNSIRTTSDLSNYYFYDKNSINNIGDFDEKESENNNKLLINEEIIVLKDDIYNEYLDGINCILLDWICDKELNVEEGKEPEFDNVIRNINGLEMLTFLNSELKDSEFTKKFLNIINYMINSKENAYLILSDNNIMDCLMNKSFNYFLTKSNLQDEKDEETIKENNTFYELFKSCILDIFKNSLIFIEEQNNTEIYPLEKIEVLFVWGTRLLNRDGNIQTKETLFEFLSDILFSLLNHFCELYNDKLNNMLFNPEIKISENYYIKNYLILTTKIFHFLFLFKLDSVIVTNGLSFMASFSPKIDLPHIYLSSMRIKATNGKKIEEYWIDFRLFNEFYSRVKHLWKLEKLYKAHNIKVLNKEKKYDYILNNVILIKERKNIYKNELEFLFFQELDKEEEKIISPMKFILINLMSILSIANSSKDEDDMLHWIKEFKSLIKFIIVSSSNLTKINQVEIYNYLQQKCLIVLSMGLCFMKNMIDSVSICKDKIKKYFSKILNFCISIVYYQYNYNDTHKLGKKVFSFAVKAARNDLSDCAVVMLFKDYIKDNSGNILLSTQNKNIYFNQKEKILDLINQKDWNEGLFQNSFLKSEIDKNYFCLDLYEKVVANRFFLSKELDDERDTSYNDTIIELLSNYEQELFKYSNNSFEKNIKIKNLFKKYKKQCFSWRGFWSDRKMFFGENGPKLKQKLVNHYTKNFMKPILVPILDMQYYLPAFSHYDKNKLFKQSEEQNFLLSMDIDKILKSSDKTQSMVKNIKKTFEQDLSPKENYLRKIYTKSNQKLSEKLSRISNKLDLGKEEDFFFVRKDTKIIRRLQKNHFLCCIVKPSHHIKGVCFIDDNQLNFKVFLNQKTGTAMRGVRLGFTDKDDDYDQERKTCFGSYFVCHPKDKDLYKIGINYKDIKWIFRRRYYYKNSALEIFTVTNKSYYLNFKYEQECEFVIIELLQKVKSLTQIIDDLKDSKDLFGNVLGYENEDVIFKKKKKGKKSITKDKKIKLSKKIKEWKNWKISNFEFLMWLNIFSNRSYNDISQYPVFPWILSNYSDPLQIEQKNEGNIIIDYSYRDLSLPMGMLESGPESIKRKKQFMETYDTLRNEEGETEGEIDIKMKPYIYGSNYSNPSFVCNFLARLFPFTHISIELQGYDFDKPERMFLSVANSFLNSTSQKTDVRELIPEFFYLPEMFININGLNLGFLQNGQEVNDVETPCNNNPYDFIMVMRSVLESDFMSYNISSWIDLIFGSKAKGKEAENANNIFTAASYQEDIDLKKNPNKESLLRLVEFGLIPNQIMTKDCAKREKKGDVLKEKEITDQNGNLIVEKIEKNKLRVHGISDDDILKIENNNNLILKIGCSSEDKIIFLTNNDFYIEKKITKTLDKKAYVDEMITSIKFEKEGNKMFNYQFPQEYNDKVCLFLDEGKSIILGGYYDGRITLIYTEPEVKVRYLIPFLEEIPICSLTLSEDEKYLFIGNMKGNVKVYTKVEKSNEIKYEWSPVIKIIEQMSEISHINCNNELNLWASASIDGYVNIYSFPLCKLFRTFKIPTNNCRYIFLSSSPLPCIVSICNEKAISEIFVYSINGKFLSRQNCQNNISCPNIIKDLNSNDYLVYICNNTINIKSIPNLLIQVLIEDLPGIYAIFTNTERTILYATNRSGNEIYLIKDDPKS